MTETESAASPMSRSSEDRTPMVGHAVIIPGARKAGTSSLHAALAGHPAVTPGRFKEPQFFALEEAIVDANMSWYVDLFGGPRRVASGCIVDASTFYFMSERAPRLVARHVGDPRIVILLRDPTERAFAGYQYLRQRVPSPEPREFEEIVGALERSRGGGVAEAEDEALAQAIRACRVEERYYVESFHREHFGAPFETRLEDPLNILRYFGESCYSRHVIRWQEAFPGSVHLVAFERLVTEPAVALREIEEFCGLEPSPDLRELPRENPTRAARGSLARWILTRTSARRPGGPADSVIRLARTLGLGEVLRTRVLRTRRPELSDELRDRCRALLEPEYGWWEERHPSISAWWGRK